MQTDNILKILSIPSPKSSNEVNERNFRYAMEWMKLEAAAWPIRSCQWISHIQRVVVKFEYYETWSPHVRTWVFSTIVKPSNSAYTVCCMSLPMIDTHMLIWATSHFREKFYKRNCVKGYGFQHNKTWYTKRTC